MLGICIIVVLVLKKEFNAIYRTPNLLKSCMMHPSQQEEALKMNIQRKIDIDQLIQYLQEEKQHGATTVTLSGKATLYTDHWNSVIMTTEPQI